MTQAKNPERDARDDDETVKAAGTVDVRSSRHRDPAFLDRCADASILQIGTASITDGRTITAVR